MCAKYKVCNDCGKPVDINSNFCPHCKSQSFRDMSTLEDIKYKLLYWDYGDGFILSKTKLIALGWFISGIIDAIISFESGAFFAGIILAIFSLIIGVVCHKIFGNDKPSINVINNNDDGLIDDFAHLLFYWQDKETGEYARSKTKIISLILAYLCALWFACTSTDAALIGAIFVGLIIGVPAFLIGYLIHRTTNSNKNHNPPKNNQVVQPNVAPVNQVVQPTAAPSVAQQPKTLSEDEKILEEVRKQKSDSELYNQIGIVFPIDELGGGTYGSAAYKIIYKNLDPSKMGTFKMYDGDTKATLSGSGDNDYCIAIQSDNASVIKYVRDTMALAKDKGLAPINKRFIYAYDLQNEPLVFAADVSNGNVRINGGGPPAWGIEDYKDKWNKI